MGPGRRVPDGGQESGCAAKADAGRVEPRGPRLYRARRACVSAARRRCPRRTRRRDGRSRSCPSVLVGAQVDDRRRRARQLAAVEHEVGGGADPLRARPRARARRARPSRWRSTAAPASARRPARPARPASAGTRRPSVAGSGPQASGKRPCGLGSSSVTAPGSSASSARARARAELGQRGERELEVEEHDRGRLLGAPALEEVQLRDRLAVVGLAGQPVDRVGREHGDAADRDAAAERLGVGGGDHRRPLTTRSMPARSGATPTSAKPARAQRRGHGGRLPGADLEREQPRRRRGRGGDQAVDDVEPVGAGEQRVARLVARDLGRQRARRPRRRAGWRAPRRRRPRRRAGRPARKATSSPSRAGVGARHGERVGAQRRWRRTSRSGRSSLSASATAPLPVPTSTTRAPAGSSSAASTSSSVSGRGTSTRASTRRSRRRKPFVPTM